MALETKIRLQVSGEKAIYGKIKELPMDRLKLSPTNPRYSHKKETLTDKELEGKIWKEGDTKKLYNSIIASKGLSDPIFIRSDGTVIEGNRRLTCLRHAKKLCNEGKLKGTEKGTFDKVQVIIIPENVGEVEIDILLARWHVSGKKEWNAINQAEHIFKLHNMHGKTFENIAEMLGKSKGWVYQKCQCYKWTNDFLALHEKGNISDFSFFEELYKKKNLRKKLENDEKFRNEFHEWILTDKFSDTGARDIRELPDVMANEEAFETFKESGIKIAKLVLAEENPEYGIKVFKSVKRAIEDLRKINRYDYLEIPQHEHQVSLLRELHGEIEKIFKELDIDFR